MTLKVYSKMEIGGDRSMKERTYVCCDLKSFYASVECVERGLDPMTTNLVVADLSRTGKTICLAVSPPLKAYGISGRARLFEVVQRVKEVNARRRQSAPGGQFAGTSWPVSYTHLDVYKRQPYAGGCDRPGATPPKALS